MQYAAAISGGAQVALDIYDRLSTGGRGRHTLSLNKPGPEDVLLYEEEFRKGSSFMSTVEHTFSYRASSNEEITSVVAEDQWSDDTGGNPEVVSGGVGYREVKIKVKSQKNRGFNFHFYVFGKKN